MKYTPPEKGPYESGITARSLFDTVDSLLREHVTPEFKARIEEKYEPGTEKQWEHPDVTRELSEFVESYFFQNLGVPEEGLDDLFIKHNDKEQEFKKYIGSLVEIYGSEDEAYNAFSALVETLLERRKKLRNEIFEIRNLEDEDSLIIETAVDAYAHASPAIVYIDVVRAKFKKLRGQS